MHGFRTIVGHLRRSGVFLSALVLVVVLLIVISTPLDVAPRPLEVKNAAGSSFSFHRAERCVMRRINKIRARHGLSRLKSDPQLGYVSRKQARKIARAGSLFHDVNFGDKITRWYSLGQNTGAGTGCRNAVRAFVHDPVHMEIILGPWNFHGAGVKRGSDGLLYVQHIFESQTNPGNIYNIP
jgi:hypothetical protein